MTSDATRNPTIQFFKDRSYFQLDPQQFFFFEQEMIPCLTPEGKILMESKVKVARSPNGNGGLYEALKQSGALDDMSKRGIEYVFQYSVDNSLIKMADPGNLNSIYTYKSLYWILRREKRRFGCKSNC